ncbi:MAG: basic secretory family protein [Armatimonadota bacterium]|nr:basic secretory family protein [Armatimonadota bacterium]
MMIASRRFFTCVAVGFVSSFGFLAQPSEADDQKPPELSKYIYPLAAPIPREPTVTVDVSDNPEAQVWADEAQKLVSQWFPIVWRLLATDGVTPPQEIKLVFKKKIQAPAYAIGSSLFVNGEWISQHPDDLGMMIHELTHIVQRYPNKGNKPGWLVEGIADFIRWWRYEPEAPRTRIDPLKASYRDAYRTTAAFLAWVTAKYDRRIVPRLDKALREGQYTDDIFKEMTGKDLDTLWSEFSPRPATQLTTGITPPETWQEHWFEHRQLLKRVEHNEDVAIYFDDDVQRPGTEWLAPFMTKLWRYTKTTYGSFGPEGRLYAIFHQGKYSGGHPSTYFDASHDYRNVSDCGPGPWNSPQYDLASHEVAHIVEGASNGVHGSPAFGLWGDSKWAEFYQYDLYVALDMKEHAQRVHDRFTKVSDNFPKPDTHWFRDWFYPLWRDHGHAQVMVKFFQLLAKHYPKGPENDGKNQHYTRNMNWGEYIHFMSGAAGTGLKPLATKAFGWPAEWDDQYQKARAEFSAITY